MASTITAGNATNGLALTSDNTGILELKTGTGAGTTALTLNASQNATVAGTLTVGSTLQVAGVATNMYPIVSGTAVTASGTSVDFTGIPSWAKRITAMFNNVSTSSTNAPVLQIGPGTSPETSGYTGYSVTHGGSGVSYHAYSSAFSSDIKLFSTTWTAAYPLTGKVTFELLDSSTNTWIINGMIVVIGNTNTETTIVGAKSLASALGMVRVTIDGSNTFDAGTINIMWE